ncbi:hypothetical protein DSECCO2_599340 [anaerobic digester metagenome]
MAVVFGDEKSPTPTPRRTRRARITPTDVVASSIERQKRPTADIAIPTEAICPGCIRSARRPDRGATKTWTIGCTRRRVPAATGS